MKNIGTIEQNLEQSLNAIKVAAENEAGLLQLPEFFPQYKNKDVSKYRIGFNSDIINSFQYRPIRHMRHMVHWGHSLFY